MKKISLIAALCVATLVLTACAKSENDTKLDHEASSAVVEKISPEQQAAIDALDQPVLDEKNTDIPAEIANAPADEASPDASERAASATQPH